MATELETLDIRSRRLWRAWLTKHHASSRGVWFVFHKKHSGVSSLPYEDAIREALCFGWIDSIVRRIDDDRYALKFTPRRPTSKWSDINRKRWAELEASGVLSAAGKAAAPTDKRAVRPPRLNFGMPAYITDALKANPKAWSFFQTLAPGYRRHFVGWIHIAKRPETREKRIQESIALLEAGKKLGLK